MEENIIDHIEEHNEADLKNALIWWEGKRIWFNVIVFMAGIVPVAKYASKFNTFDLIGIVLYGLLFNMLYSVGFLVEAYGQHYLSDRFELYKFRMIFFVIGVGTSALFTLVLAYFSNVNYPF